MRVRLERMVFQAQNEKEVNLGKRRAWKLGRCQVVPQVNK